MGCVGHVTFTLAPKRRGIQIGSHICSIILIYRNLIRCTNRFCGSIKRIHPTFRAAHRSLQLIINVKYTAFIYMPCDVIALTWVCGIFPNCYFRNSYVKTWRLVPDVSNTRPACTISGLTGRKLQFPTRRSCLKSGIIEGYKGQYYGGRIAVP